MTVMGRVFVDTSFYMAILAEEDQWHETASNVLRELQAELFTTEYILVELGAAMRRGSRRAIFAKFINGLVSDELTHTLPASTRLLEKGLALFASRNDKEWSLTDCISFVVMEDMGITEALSTDHHFEQAGFQVILRR